MATHVSPNELRKMQLPELRREIERTRLDIAKMRLEMRMKSLKDTAKYTRAKLLLACMLTIGKELEKASVPAASDLKKKRKRSTLPVSQ